VNLVSYHCFTTMAGRLIFTRYMTVNLARVPFWRCIPTTLPARMPACVNVSC
jgi:hypothetical protein